MKNLKSKLVLILGLIGSLSVSAHTLTLVVHKNDQSLSSGSMVCHSIEHCKYLIKSYEYRNQDSCHLVEIKDGNRVVYRKYYNH
jgi:hypothetical protein